MNNRIEPPKIDPKENDVSNILSPPVNTNPSPVQVETINEVVNSEVVNNTNVTNNIQMPIVNDHPITIIDQNNVQSKEEQRVINEYLNGPEVKENENNLYIKLAISIVNLLITYPYISRIGMIFAIISLIAGNTVLFYLLTGACIAYTIFTIYSFLKSVWVLIKHNIYILKYYL